METIRIGRYEFRYRVSHKDIYIERVEPGNGAIVYFRYFHRLTKTTREYLPERGVQDFEKAWYKTKLLKPEATERG